MLWLGGDCCAWRVNINEYSSKLAEAYRLSNWHGPNSDVKRSPRRGRTAKTGTQRRRSTASTSSSGAVQLNDGESEKIHKAYSALTDSLKTIEGRVDRSFHALMASMSITESERAIVRKGVVANEAHPLSYKGLQLLA
jgi:hypothetical protein